MSKHTEQDTFTAPRPSLRLDRANRKLLGVCGGFARYLEVPPALVRVIYCIACLVSPFLIPVYFVLYWLLEDEQRPARMKAAISGMAPASSYRESTDEAANNRANAYQRRAPDADPGTGKRFDIKRPLYRSRNNVRVAGVCAGVADYLGVSTFIVRLFTFLSLFILGGVTLWGYVILWIVLDKEPKAGKKARAGHAPGAAGNAQESVQEDEYGYTDFASCAEAIHGAEHRLREVEAFITSKQFRLHCEINRI
jgi:phage shock protein C